MGRIEEALKRASESQQSAVPRATPPAAASGADTGVFESPWSFAPDEAPADAPESAAAPQGILLKATVPAAPVAGEEAGPATTFRRSLTLGSDRAERLVVGPQSSPVLTEQFRRLAATLHHAQLVQGTKVVMVVSALPGDGKTLTATNLALTLSESYRRQVLLIDADLRRPSLHEVFRVPNVAGLNDGLKASRDGKLAVMQITDRLTLLPAGRPDPDPMSSLTSARMGEILQEASSRFDWVIVDTAPLGLLADTSLLTVMVDAALLVIRAGETPFAQVEKAVEAVGRDRIIGVVLNGGELNSSEEGYYGRYAPEAVQQQALAQKD